MLAQDSRSFSAYFTTLKGNRDELFILQPLSNCSCGALKDTQHLYDTKRVFQSLMVVLIPMPHFAIKCLPWIPFPL